jgi:hypothetical protein
MGAITTRKDANRTQLEHGVCGFGFNPHLVSTCCSAVKLKICKNRGRGIAALETNASVTIDEYFNELFESTITSRRHKNYSIDLSLRFHCNSQRWVVLSVSG